MVGSLMERLVHPLGMSVLEMNYRSHPNVVPLFSDLFYASIVGSAISGSEFPAIKGIYWPQDERLSFVDVEDLEENESCGIHNYKQVVRETLDKQVVRETLELATALRMQNIM